MSSLISNYACSHCSEYFKWCEINLHEDQCQANRARLCRWCQSGVWHEVNLPTHERQCKARPNGYRDPSTYNKVLSEGSPNGGIYWQQQLGTMEPLPPQHPVAAKVVREQYLHSVKETANVELTRDPESWPCEDMSVLSTVHYMDETVSRPFTTTTMDDDPQGSVCSRPSQWLMEGTLPMPPSTVLNDVPIETGIDIPHSYREESDHEGDGSVDSVAILRAEFMEKTHVDGLPQFELPKLPPKMNIRHVKIPPTINPTTAFLPTEDRKHRIPPGLKQDPFVLFQSEMISAPREVYKRETEEYLSRIQSRHQLCRYCCKSVKSSVLTIHEKGCRANPMNQCKYCGRGFEGNGYQDAKTCVMKHQELCESSPFSESQCGYCDVKLKSSYELGSAFDQLIVHEKTCSKNAAIQCTFCFQPCLPTCGTESASEARIRHEIRCRKNPDNYASCRNCGKHLVASDVMTIDAAMIRHRELCPKHPNHMCRYCQKGFSRGLGRTARENREFHEQKCRSQAMQQHKTLPWSTFQNRPSPSHYMPSVNSSNSVPVRMQHRYEAEDGISIKPLYYDRTAPSTPSINDDDVSIYSEVARPARFVGSSNMGSAGDKISLAAEREMAKIDNEIFRLETKEKQRSALRKYQLLWHPDKAIKYETDQDLAVKVFEHVQSLWKQLILRVRT